MAARFWVGGTGSWDQATTTHWSATTGGAGGASVPTIADDVTFDALSGGGTVTVTATAPCLSFNAAAFTGGITLSGGLTVTGGGNVALPTAGITIGGVFGITMSGGAAATITFNSSTIGGGLAIGNFSGTDKVTIQDTCRVNGTLTHNAGTLDTNGQTCTWLYYTTDTGVGTNKTLTLGASQITCTGGDAGGNGWNFASSSSITFNAGTSTIILSRTPVALRTATGPYTFNNVSMTGAGNCNTNVSTGTVFNNFSRIGTAVKTDGFNTNTNFTVNGVFTVTGNSATNRLLIQSITTGTQRTISLGTTGTVSATNVDFMDFKFTGTNIPATGTSLGDTGGNANITFDAPAAQTWSGNTTGTWSTAANWTSRVPLPQDNVVVNGLASGTLTVDMPRVGASVDFTGSTAGHVTLSNNITIFGSWTYVSTLVVTGNFTFTFAGRGAYTLTCAGIGPATSSSLIAPSGTLTQQDNFLMQNAAGQLNITNGTWVANGFNMRSTLYAVAAGTTFDMGGGTITAIGTAGVITATGTIIPGASTFVISDISASTKTFTGAGKTFYNLQINGAASAGAVQMTGSNTFNNITGQANAHLSLTSVTTTTISSLTSRGTAGNLFVLDAVTPGSAATLSCANRINTDFISVKDNTASGNTPFYAGTSGVLVSGTTNWLINSAPGTIPIYFTKAPTVMVIR